MPTDAQAIWMTGMRQISVRAEELPTLAADAVAITTLHSAISHGTEMLVYRGQVPADLALDLPTLAGSFGFPIKYGYALVGEVTACGMAVSSHQVGDQVFVLHPHQTHLQVPAAQAKRIPAGIAPSMAVFAANMETAINIVHDLRPALGDVVVVVGLGVVGLLVTWLLARQQLTSVIGVDPVPLRRALAQQLGAAVVCAPSDAAAVVAVASQGRGADGVVEVSGNPAALAGAVAMAGFEAQVVVASWYGTKAVTLDLGSHFHRSRIRLRASQVGHLAPDLLPRWDYARRMDVVWRLLAQFPADILISHQYHFSDAAQAYALVDGGGADVIQVVLDYAERNRDV